MTINTVVFDAVATLIKPVRPVEHTYHRIGKRFGSRMSLVDVQRLFWPTFRRVMQSRTSPATNESIEIDFWRTVVFQIFDDVPIELRQSIFETLWSEFGLPQSWELYPDVQQSIHSLQVSGFEIAVASNFDQRLGGICRKLLPSIDKDRVYDSAGIGFVKPHVQFFHEVRLRLASPSHELVMVGDSMEADVRGALEAGWHAILVARGANEAIGNLEHRDDEEDGKIVEMKAQRNWRSVRSLSEVCDSLADVPD